MGYISTLTFFMSGMAPGQSHGPLYPSTTSQYLMIFSFCFRFCFCTRAEALASLLRVFTAVEEGLLEDAAPSTGSVLRFFLGGREALADDDGWVSKFMTADEDRWSERSTAADK